ncbi:signal peptidase I [Lacticaseibacillus daqingensis]|uniref:signal peptidase I n=1 Tax=Lacticaseibacillus daqingensis TaxID=2486014 RepID=UPI000F76A38F|nr:signal peptidase I [Lacticaseibacillus daqingensis]
MTHRKEWRQLRQLLQWMLMVIAVVAVIFGIRVILGLFLENNSITGNSMAPTLQPGERIVSVKTRTLHRNDIVILHGPDDPKRLYIKRVIGMPGDTVQVTNEKLVINGQPVAQPYLKPAFMAAAVKLWAKQHQQVAEGVAFTTDFSLTSLAATGAARVPAGQYFVLGDNRRVSYDSRNFGFVKQRGIVAVVKWRYWPLNRMGGID